jgi:seryl-tRNA synthetase
MKDLKSVYAKQQDKKRQLRELKKVVKDALASDREYTEAKNEIEKLRAKMKQAERRVTNDVLSDVQQLDTLKLEIRAADELLSDISLTMYANHENVEILDESRGIRMTPTFRVKFSKEEMESESAKAAAQRAASHPERTFTR